MTQGLRGLHRDHQQGWQEGLVHYAVSAEQDLHDELLAALLHGHVTVLKQTPSFSLGKAKMKSSALLADMHAGMTRSLGGNHVVVASRKSTRHALHPLVAGCRPAIL